MTDEELFKLLRPIIIAATKVSECILSNPNTTAPDGPYCSVQPSKNVVERGQPNVKYENAGTQDVTISVRRQLISEVSINFYRGEARHTARRLKGAHRLPSVHKLLLESKLGWNRTGPVINLTALQSNQMEQRAQISLFIMYEEYDTDDSETVNAIEKVPIEVSQLVDGVDKIFVEEIVDGDNQGH